MIEEVVVDSSVVLAILKKEPGSEVEGYLSRALISTVNLAEVGTKLVQLGYSDDDATSVVNGLNLLSIPFTEDFVSLTVSLSRLTKPYGLSLGDRACLALGITKKLPVLTADTIWADIDLPVEVRLIR